MPQEVAARGVKDAMRQDSYETILRAVGRILDQAEAQRFSVRSSESGLVVDAFDASGEKSLGETLDLGELVQLVDWVHTTSETSEYVRASAADAGTLEQFLRERQVASKESREGELVGAL
jgi:hypothetical protein